MARTKKALRVHNKLLDALHKVDRPGEVCAWGDRPLTMPGLEVEGLGAVRLPLGKTQARKLIKLCRQAPYGQGTETVVDTDVRRVWELDPDQFQLTNPKWDDFVASIIEDMQQALGLEGRKLAAQLYKLLVYNKGSFFLPHRDGEKLDRMVATLVIGLPAEHEGGELVVSHDGRQHEIAFFGAASGHEQDGEDQGMSHQGKSGRILGLMNCPHITVHELNEGSAGVAKEKSKAQAAWSLLLGM